jgi:hypothetical protein
MTCLGGTEGWMILHDEELIFMEQEAGENHINEGLIWMEQEAGEKYIMISLFGKKRRLVKIT